MKNFLLTLTLSLLCSIGLHAQANDLEFLVNKIKTEYPGYAEKTKGINFDEFVAETVSENNSDTFKMMAKITDFFKDRHLDLVKIADSTQIDRIRCNLDFVRIKEYLNSKIKKKQYEGYWLNDYNNCVMAIRQENKTNLKGYVIESRDSNFLYPGMLAYEFDSMAPNSFFTKFTSDYSGVMIYIWSSFRNDSLLITGADGKWKKLKNYTRPILNSLPVHNDTARAVLLDKDNFLITIPISDRSNVDIVDSLVKANYRLISQTRNLIIDIRQNMGGLSKAYRPLLPFIYTRPIEKINREMLCTQGRIDQTREELKAYLEKGIDSSLLKDWYVFIKMEEDSIGKFIAAPLDTFKFDSVMAYPKHVGIIINYACQSAAEMMLLDCKQSDKVTLFGEHTMGAVDYLDYYPLKLPSKKYKLKIATSRRIIPRNGSKLDYKGIYPDVPISDSEKNWVGFVRKWYQKK